MDDIHIKLGSLPVRISSDDGDFLEYTLSHFAPVTIDPPARCAVEARFTRGPCEEEQTALARYDRIGRGIYTDGKTVIWNTVPYFPAMTMSFLFEGETLAVRAYQNTSGSMKSTVKNLVRAIYGQSESRSVFYFELLYYLVYYPVFRMLSDRGIHALHGGGIEAREKRIVVVGAQGTGKSTLIANLLAGSGSRFLSDNIILFDSRRVYSCHEPVRLDTGMLDNDPLLREMVSKIDLDVPLGRTAGNVRRESYIESMEPDIFIIPRITRSATSLEPCTKEDVVRKALYFNSLADEVRSFDIFASVLGQVFPPKLPPCSGAEALSALLEGRELYELGIGYGEDPGVTARAFIESVTNE